MTLCFLALPVVSVMLALTPPVPTLVQGKGSKRIPAPQDTALTVEGPPTSKTRFDFLLHTGTALHETGADFAFAVADWDRDGIVDLFAIKKRGTGTHSTEVHILSGASRFQSFLLHTGTALHETGGNVAFAVADWNRDGTVDLIAIKKSGTDSHNTEVHVLSGASGFRAFSLQTRTALHETGGNNDFAFSVANGNRDEVLDLIAIKKRRTGSQSTEVHILSGASGLQSFALQTGTALHETGGDSTFAFCTANWDRDGVPDLFAIKQSGTGTHSTEVHILKL